MLGSTFSVLALVLLQLSSAVSPESLVDDVRKLTVARDNDERFDALTRMLDERGLPYAVETFMLERPPGNDTRTRGRNVVVSLGSGADEILVGAHYDAVRLRDGSLSRGAVDNGAATVMLVRLAEALRSERLPVRLRFVWFDMEEVGLVGSSRYVEAHAADRFRAVLNFDINAYGDTIVFGAPEGGSDAPLRRAALSTCAREAIDCLRFEQMPPGDDRTFGKARLPTLSIGVLPALEAHQIWLLLHGGTSSGLTPGTTPPILRTIHTADDVVEKVDGAAVARMHRFALALLRELASLSR